MSLDTLAILFLVGFAVGITSYWTLRSIRLMGTTVTRSTRRTSSSSRAGGTVPTTPAPVDLLTGEENTSRDD